MGKDDEAVLSDAAKAEIAEAVRIVASDKAYQNTKAIRDHLIPPTPETDPPKEGDPKPPPKKDDPPASETDDTDGGLWWHKDRLKESQ